MTLTRVQPGSDPGWRRLRAGSGFRYVDPLGNAPSAEEKERIVQLVIPPAWHDVWIALDPLAHIQAVGTDEADRRQYIYHPQWSTGRDRRKFSRVLVLAAALPRARAHVTRSLRRDTTDREFALATAFRILDAAAPRIGSTRYFTRYGSRGLTTLQRRDATIEDKMVSLSFPAKGNKLASLQILDEDLAIALSRLSVGAPSARLLWYQDGRRRTPLHSQDVNTYVSQIAGGRFTAKDFRTLRGTIVAADALARCGPASSAPDRQRFETLAVQATADALGNTPAVARRSYIDPRVFQHYAKSRVMDLTVSPETAIRELLGGSRKRMIRQ